MFEITPENAVSYLRSTGRLGAETAQAQPLGWGVSNAVIKVTTPKQQIILKQSRPQLRTAEDWFSDLDRVFREAATMELLRPLLPVGAVPEVLFVDRPNFLLAMTPAPPNSVVWKEQLLAGQTDRQVARQAGILLGRIHERTHAIVSTGSAGRLYGVDLNDRRVFDQLRIEPFYQRVCQRRPEVADAIMPLIQQLYIRRDALCHGDFTPKNFLVHSNGTGLFTLVDYETAHFGDPTMDIGLFLAHLVLKAIHRPRQADAYLDLVCDFWRAYLAQVTFGPVEELAVRGIAHCGVCILSRIDGTSPVDYLTDEPPRETARNIGRNLLRSRPRTLTEMLSLVRNQLQPLISAKYGSGP